MGFFRVSHFFYIAFFDRRSRRLLHLPLRGVEFSLFRHSPCTLGVMSAFSWLIN